MSGINPSDIKSFLESKNFEITKEDRLKLGKKCMGVFNRFVPAAKQHHIWIQKANKKINSCVDACVRELQKQQAWVEEIIKAFPADKMRVLKLHKEVIDILNACPEEYRDDLLQHLRAVMKEGGQRFSEYGGGALEVATSFIQLAEVKKMYKATFGEECCATTIEAAKHQFLEKMVGKEVLEGKVDVLKVAGMSLEEQQKELIKRVVASRREPLAKELKKATNQAQSLKAEVETLVQKQAALKGEIEGLAQQSAKLDANLTRLVEERNKVVAAKAERYHKREEAISLLQNELSKFFVKNAQKLESDRAKLEQAKKEEQAKIDEIDSQLEADKNSLEDVISQLLRLNKQQTVVGKDVDALRAQLLDYNRIEQDLQKDFTSLEAVVTEEVRKKSPVTILQELIAPPAGVVGKLEEKEDFEAKESVTEPDASVILADVVEDVAVPDEASPIKAVQALIGSVSQDSASVSTLVTRLVTPLLAQVDAELINLLSTYLAVEQLPKMSSLLQKAQTNPELLQTVASVVSKHLPSATAGQSPDIHILNALKGVLQEVCAVLASPKSLTDPEALKKNASLHLLANSLPKLDTLKADTSKNDKMATALTVASPALSLLGNSFGRSLAVGRVVAAIEKKLAPTVVLSKQQKKALEQIVSEVLKKISESGMLSELKGLVDAMKEYLKSNSMSANDFMQIAFPKLLSLLQKLDKHFIPIQV